eukprot:15008193-Alexandrium_andersonii.AAC.1
MRTRPRGRGSSGRRRRGRRQGQRQTGPAAPNSAIPRPARFFSTRRWAPGEHLPQLPRATGLSTARGGDSDGARAPGAAQRAGAPRRRGRRAWPRL